MHEVFFGFKRVHLRVLKLTRVFMPKEVALTPARFDMMRIVELHAVRWGWVAQHRIQDLLGVSAATVSRMLKSLEALGFVVRERMDHDLRMRRIHITELGRERVRAALRALVESRKAERLALIGLDREARARPKLRVLKRYLSTIRKRYGDPAPFEHPWTLEEIEPEMFGTISADGTISYRPLFAA